MSELSSSLDKNALKESFLKSFFTIKSDDNEQYSRRSSLRINNIPLPEANKKETSEDVLMKVKEVIAESATIVPDIALDRAHRVGKAFTAEDGTRNLQVIVKFTTWHHHVVIKTGKN